MRYRNSMSISLPQSRLIFHSTLYMYNSDVFRQILIFSVIKAKYRYETPNPLFLALQLESMFGLNLTLKT